MAVTVISRPIGHKLNTVDISATVLNSSGDALIYTGIAHGLVDGDYIYIESDLQSYNGFKLVDSISYDSFKIKDNDTDYVPFKQSVSISYRVSVLDHGYQCVHLPIVYKLHSDLYPLVESDDIGRTVTGFSNQNGFTGINLSDDLVDPILYGYIVLIGDGPLAGKYQISQTVVVDNAVTINLAYNASNIFSGYEVRAYFNNYFVTVKVYGGLLNTHTWYDEKPVELITTLKFIPDSNGDVLFSIAEILKGQITTRNNLELDTLPNNLDFFTQFYISVSETYDVSDGTDIVSTEGMYTQDMFIGEATNSVLPFKNINSGHMSDYVCSDDESARWLTTMERPTAFIDRFFDLSFINREEGDIWILVNDVQYLFLDNPGIGVLRVPLDLPIGTNCIKAIFPEMVVPPVNIYQPVMPALSTFSNGSTGTITWAISAHPTYSGSGFFIGKVLYSPYQFLAGYTYVFNYSFTFGGGGFSVDIGSYSGSGNTLITYQSVVPSGAGTQTGSVSIVCLADTDYIGIKPSGAVPVDITINSFTAGTAPIHTEAGYTIPGHDITETICIDVVDECSPSFTNDNLRLTEGGQFRALE